MPLFLSAPRAVLRTFALALCASATFAHAAPAAAPQPPKLVVVLVVDGLPNEQVMRYRHQFGRGGFERLLSQGASYSNAHQAHGVTVTAVGHAAILTGAYPHQHGVIGNNWIDADTGAAVYCTEDSAHTYLGEETRAGDGTSPARLRVDTLGDELRYASGNQAKVIAVSGKDRGAILLAGKTGTAYMYMDKTGNFASSSYYMAAHPQWVQRHQAAKPQDRFYGKAWRPLLAETAYAHDASEALTPAKPGTRTSFPFSYYSENGNIDGDYYARLRASPYLDELTLDFARAAIEGEQLGKNTSGYPDLIGVSLSAHDYINHAFGPESKMSHDHLQRLDRMLASFFDYLDQRVGAGNAMVILTADHGFPNTPEFARSRRLDAGRIDADKLVTALNDHLASKYKAGKLVRIASMPNIHFDHQLIAKAGLRRQDVEQTASQFLLERAGIARVFTRTQLEDGASHASRLGTLMQRAWHPQLSGDLMVVSKPSWYFSSGSSGTSHGSPYGYDTNVPMMFMGPRWFRAGRAGQYAEVVDIAPTLAHLLNLRPPPASEGRVLTEVLR
jgi:predicted AlkP superfamily pyrophosphatase or phosphodiesterase